MNLKVTNIRTPSASLFCRIWVAQKFHLAAHDRHTLRQAALIHDVGERVMNREYIEAAGNLTAQERIGRAAAYGDR